MASTPARVLLETGLNGYELKLNRGLLDALEEEFRSASKKATAPEGQGEVWRALGCVTFLRRTADEEVRRLGGLRRAQADFQAGFLRAANEAERRQRILDYARELGASPAQLRGDRRAFRRWFGADAVTDRYARRQAATERRLSFRLERMGRLSALCLETAGKTGAPEAAKQPAAGAEAAGKGRAAAADPQTLWLRLDLEEAIHPYLSYDGDPRVRTAALRCLAVALGALPTELRERALGGGVLERVHRFALDRRQPVWIQCEGIALLRLVSPESFEKVVRRRLTDPVAGEDLFVRARAVRLLADAPAAMPGLADLLRIAAADPSPFVRQAAAQAASRAPTETARACLARLAREDAVPAVRAAALLEAAACRGRAELRPDLLALVTGALEKEQDAFVLRVVLQVATEEMLLLEGSSHPDLPAWREQVPAALARVHRSSPCLSARRWAAAARERILCAANPEARALRDRLAPALRAIPPGTTRALPAGLLDDPSGRDGERVGRVLALLAQDDYGYDLQVRRGVTYATRGHVFGFRGWRFVHELRNPSPDKRQAFRHTVGRICYAELRAPSNILCELAQTKVPGEPLFLPSEGGWRPYLPLPDDFVSSLDPALAGSSVRFWTSEGVTEVSPPPTLLGKVRAYARLTWEFPRFARLRNWREGDLSRPSAYAEALTALGFRIRYAPHAGPARDAAAAPEGSASAAGAADGRVDEGDGADPSVRRFFPATLVSFFDPTLWSRLQEYFVSVYQNSLGELAAFVAAALGLFFASHLYSNWTHFRARARLPLVLGGWGTRGKSGTERLKGALLNALGYAVFSKTTGCEAMFLHAHAFLQTREMFLFRPYDKATIWEQRDVVRLAARLGVDVFLWECMALMPSYVHALQHHWMHDDLSTITNTYPDHEDIQGPAGVNIPEVIARFIPPASRAITSEELMLPILRKRAAEVGTSLGAVGWLEAGLLTPDVLARFPYEEHPYNLALVLAVAGELGVERDFALKEMADRVVPDLGVLKTTPAAPLRTRRLEFSNGMSANERHGCVSNWLRLGFDAQDPEAEPGVWLTTVVNNRADRIPRSQVFAGVLVNDCLADRHVLIGGNLTGLMGYVRESWAAYAATVSLWPERDVADNARASTILRDLARRFRLPLGDGTLRARLRVMVAAALPASTRRAVDAPGSAGESPAPGAGDAAEALAELWSEPNALRERLAALGAEASFIALIHAHAVSGLEALRELEALTARVAQAERPARAELDGQVREFLRKQFFAKFVIVEDYYATGDQIIDRICEETPPGFRNRVMGIQNIKGTGLDFVYRWLAWDACHRLCARLAGANPREAEEGLRALVAFQEYGVLCEEHVRATVDAVRRSPLGEREGVAPQLDLVLANLERGMEAVRKRLAAGQARTGRMAAILGFVEKALDAGDAVRRRKKANRIYEDLCAERTCI
ncbi:MAG: HEAT repeat domain-containing protein [Planctomycetes bacterium]|nr:HEAT repeat domain-containing protein [Planctomycetota bacterium]